ncbi:MAG: cytochrome c3 family protein [Armatimonadetes bacterium]|nr:cytochrome c3 family protein [Armatimonadota bacterium]
MPNLFRPSANAYAKLSLALSAALPVLLITVGSGVSRSSANTGVMNHLDQPVPFSHKHHAYELGIDCRYCHTSVEKSSYAGIPQTETCMTCHSQIWQDSPLLEPVRQSFATGQPLKWTEVNKVPEFVYFNHSIHVNRGVNCNNCHGQVQQMQITQKGRALFMSWCLECHREPEKYLFTDEKNPQMSPRQQVFNLYLKYQSDPLGDEMNPQEKSLIFGNEQKTNVKALIERGNQLLKDRGVRKQELTDCTVCHH